MAKVKVVSKDGRVLWVANMSANGRIDIDPPSHVFAVSGDQYLRDQTDLIRSLEAGHIVGEHPHWEFV